MSGRSEPNGSAQGTYPTGTYPTAAKIIISGGFGVGKTTLIGAISDIEPMVTEEALTSVSVGIDDTTALPDKTTTTVAFDFGRLRLSETIVLYLFGTPGQERFSFLWDDLTEGALGAVVLADTRRIEECYAVLDYFEELAVPFVLAVNKFDRADHFDLDEVREALGVQQAVPVVECDARQRDSVKNVLVTLMEQVLSRRSDPRYGDPHYGDHAPLPISAR